jgi:hypothetical protein
MHDSEEASGRDRWARLRFAIVGPVLAAPPTRGALRATLAHLAAQRWQHPITRAPITFAFSTIERCDNCHGAPGDARSGRRAPAPPTQGRWSATYTVRAAAAGGAEPVSGPPELAYQLHLDNLAVLLAADPTLGRRPSYTTLRRYMTAQGWRPAPRPPTRDTPGATVAAHRRAALEVRSFEAEYVHGLWHLDFHHGSRKVLSRTGVWARPMLLGVLDDCSRLACHLQWYLDETAETLVHGLAQAIQKRGLPRALLTDNGAAMLAAEVRHGLERLGIVHETTLPYSPYQNADRKCSGPTSKGGCWRCSRATPT